MHCPKALISRKLLACLNSTLGRDVIRNAVHDISHAYADLQFLIEAGLYTKNRVLHAILPNHRSSLVWQRFGPPPISQDIAPQTLLENTFVQRALLLGVIILVVRS